jgi:hypothetical protein
MGDYDILRDGKVRVRTSATDSLNYLFNTGLADTYSKVQYLRQVHPNFLKPSYSGTPKDRRKESLRFAAFQLADGVNFSTDYPAGNFQKFMRWLTWLGRRSGGGAKLQVMGADGTVADWVPNTGVPRTPSALILETLKEALPVSGSPHAVHFSFDDQPLAVMVNKYVDPWTITVYSIKEDEGVGGNSDDEDQF